MVEFDFLVRESVENHMHGDIEFFYVMDGACSFTLEDKQYRLGKEDFLIVNVDKSHSYIADDNRPFLAACIHISFSELSRMMKQNLIFFWCNTAVDDNEACDDVRSVVKRIISEQYQNGGRDVIYMNNLYFGFLHVLTNDFLLNKDDSHYSEETHKFDARKHEIEEFIRLNFDKQISLEELADRLFLSYAYLSKYIKKHFGMGFTDYVNSVRLNYAVSQLLHSDQSVVRIAMDAGFSSSAALNKVFKEKYGITPTDYRRKWANQDKKFASTLEEKKNIQQQLSQHFQSQPEEKRTDKKNPEEIIIVQHVQKKLLKKNWCKMINMGSAADLLHSDMQSHVLYLRDELHFEYVRFWDLYDPELFIIPRDGSQSFNFSMLDRVIDFLLKNGLKPYIELRVKPKKVLSNKNDVLIYKKPDEMLDKPKYLEGFAAKLMIHLLNRYSSELVESWCFELWHSEPEQFLEDQAPVNDAVQPSVYLDRFDVLARVMRTYLPSIRLGGGGFSLRYGNDAFRELLEMWKKREYKPDFITLYCYPYTMSTYDKGRNQSKNADFLLDSLVTARNILDETDFPTKELHISEWNFSISNRNVLNDHCMKGAYLVKNMIDSIDLADIIGYWTGSDLYAVYYDTKTVLNGSGGLLSKDGIRKPAFFAFDFMNRLGKYIRKKDEHYIITDNGSGNWRIVCHNLKNLNYQYGLYSEDEVRPEDQNNLFTDLKKRKMHFELPSKKDGKYMLRIHSVNREHGSLQDEWMEMSRPEELSADDLKYLGRITTPGMILKTCEAENGKLSFDVVLEPNEITYIHVTNQYS